MCEANIFKALFNLGNAHQFHHDVVDVSFSAYIVYPDDILMSQSRCCLRLPLEVLYKRRVLRKFRPQNLDGDKSVQQFVLCLIHNGHAAVSDFL